MCGCVHECSEAMDGVCVVRTDSCVCMCMRVYGVACAVPVVILG